MTAGGTDSSRRRSLGLGVTAFGLAAGGKLLPAWATSSTDETRVKRTLYVGPAREIKTLRQAAKLARDHDLVLIDAGEYRRDVAVWEQSGLLIRGNGGKVTLHADGASAEGKGIFVFRRGDAMVEGIEFRGSRSSDRNGAGIRMDVGSRLSVNRCAFEDNETGILTSNDGTSELHVADSSFVRNGTEGRHSHNVYVGAIRAFTFTGCYSARVKGAGHLLKSRARESVIAYCRLTGEDGTSSYELEFPNGGRAVVLGCLIQQGPKSENAVIVSYGAEGYRWEQNEFRMSFSTVVNDGRWWGTFVRISSGAAKAELVDNLMVGPGRMDLRVSDPTVRNSEAKAGDFADLAGFDWRLRRSSKLVGAAGISGTDSQGRARPEREYVHQAGSAVLEGYSAMSPLSPGALQRLAP